jgi:hypothetical protein
MFFVWLPVTYMPFNSFEQAVSTSATPLAPRSRVKGLFHEDPPIALIGEQKNHIHAGQLTLFSSDQG